MRGEAIEQEPLFAYRQTSDFIPKGHPIRVLRGLTDEALQSMQGPLSSAYSHTGRPSIPPEQLIRALLLQIFFSIRSERQLMEQLDYNILFRWFVGLSLEDTVWDASSFSKNRQRVIDYRLTKRLLDAVVSAAKTRRLTSSDHFCVDGTLIDAWASQGSFQRKDATDDDDDSDRKGPPDFRNEKRCNDTHQSTTDPDARMYKKAQGQEAKLRYLGHVLMENRNGFVVDAQTTQATGTAERDAALTMLNRLQGTRRVTVGADKNYDTQQFVAECRKARVTPHVAQNTTNRRSAIDGRVTRHPGYAKSINARHRVETPFGWGKANRPLRKTMLRGLERVGTQATLVFAAFNLVKLANLEGAA